MESSGASEGNDDGLLLIVVGDDDEDPKEDENKNEASPDEVQMIEEYVDDDMPSDMINNDSDDSDEVYIIPELCDDTSEEETLDFEENYPASQSRRMRLIPLAQQKSFVNDLRRQDPCLKENTELLIDNLSKIMADYKCPTPPPNVMLEKDKKFECGVCGLKKDTKMAVARHWQERHGPRCFLCYACGADFRSQTNLYKHEKRCDSADAIIVLKARARIRKHRGTCPGRPFHLPDAYHKHDSFISFLRQNHEPELGREDLVKILCAKMAAETPPEPPVDSVICSEDQMYQCTMCAVTNASRNAVLRHWQCTHGPRYLECYACGTTYSDPRNLYKHEKRCTNPDACAVLAARALMIPRRRRRRGLDRPEFAPEDTLTDGEGEKRANLLSCKECPAVYKNAMSLQAHTLSHSGLRPFRCEFCPAKYTSATALSRHKQSHKDQTYLCDQCERTFKSKPLLKNHLNTHLPLRKNPCPHCEKRYAQKWALQIHIEREHLKLPPRCACQICPKRYPRMSLLKDHMLKKHGMSLITRRMFYSHLPHLSDSQLKNAKIIKKSDMNPIHQPEQHSFEKFYAGETDRSVGNQEIAHKVIDDDIEVVEENSTQNSQCTRQTPATQVTQNKAKSFLKCTEKLQSATEIEQQKTPKTQIVQVNANAETQIVKNNDNAKTQIVEDKDNTETPIGEDKDNSSEDLLEYAQLIQQGEIRHTKPLIVIKDGQAIFMDKNNIDFYKHKSRKREHSKFESTKESLGKDVESSVKNEPELKLNTMLQEEVISKTNRVVTVRNNVSSEEQQIRQSPKIEIKKRRKRRKQYFK